LTERVLLSDSPEATRALGQRLGELAGPGLVVLLAGELGAGKTCFAQGVAAGLGVPAATPVTSPSYTLLNIHQGRLPFYHFDLYRLPVVDDLEELGYDEHAERSGVTLVEWADRLATPLPAALRITLRRVSDLQRELRLVADDGVGRELLAALAANTL
jgi:tRNA threonylcarbamoyladenosine biosynthesis protein TsaE